MTEIKAAYKSGEVLDQSPPLITLDKIKTKLKESEIFDWEDPTLTEREKKEMNKLFDAVEIMVRVFSYITSLKAMHCVACLNNPLIPAF